MAPANLMLLLAWSLSLCPTIAHPSAPLGKRQLGSLLGAPSNPATAGNPLGAVTGALSSVPVVGSVANSLPVVGGGSSNPLGAVAGPVSGVVSTAANAVGGVPLVGGVVGGSSSSPLGAVTSPVSGVISTAANAVGGLPVVGGVANTALNTATSATSGLPAAGGLTSNLNPPALTGIPGTDPLGAFSVSVIATLLSLLKKDPLSLFAPALSIPALVKRDVPHLAERELEERTNAKRQLPGLPSLSGSLPGVGVGGLPFSGIPGVSPDLAFLVGSIAKNIAVPGGVGLGSVTNNILGVLNGAVPNFIFQLPVVHDSIPTFGVLQLLSAINPTKFRDLGTLSSLSALSQAASAASAGDLAFVRSLPASPDPSNLITTITSFTDNILSLPGNVSNLKAATAVLALKNLGLAVPGL